MADWNEKRGRVSQAFDEWKLIDADQRAFLRLGLEFADAEYNRLWTESGEEPYYDGGPDHVDSFEAKVGGLYHHDFAWMHTSGVLRDSVTNFEVYFEKAREEVLKHHGRAVAVPMHSPTWGALKRFFRQLDVVIETDKVKKVRDLRGFITHRRGELRTEELRQQFQATHSDALPAWTVELDQELVLESMDLLADALRSIDPTVYNYGWGKARVAGLRP